MRSTHSKPQPVVSPALHFFLLERLFHLYTSQLRKKRLSQFLYHADFKFEIVSVWMLRVCAKLLKCVCSYILIGLNTNKIHALLMRSQAYSDSSEQVNSLAFDRLLAVNWSSYHFCTIPFFQLKNSSRAQMGNSECMALSSFSTWFGYSRPCLNYHLAESN